MRSIPVPDSLAGFKKDKYGNVINFTAKTDSDGNPIFLVADEQKRWLCAKDRLCGICGQKLGETMVGIAGAKIAEAKKFEFDEAFMHEECARYAARACPFLGHERYDQYAKVVPVPAGIKVKEWDVPREGRPADMVFFSRLAKST